MPKKNKSEIENTKKTVEPSLIPEKKIKLSDEEKNRILDELFDNGYTTIDIDVFPGRKTVKVRSLDTGAQTILEERMKTIEGSTTQVVHRYTRECLALGLLSVTSNRNGEVITQDFENEEQIIEFLDKLPPIVVDKVGKIQHYFEKQIGAAIDYDAIEDHFFEIPST